MIGWIFEYSFELTLITVAYFIINAGCNCLNSEDKIETNENENEISSKIYFKTNNYVKDFTFVYSELDTHGNLHYKNKILHSNDPKITELYNNPNYTLLLFPGNMAGIFLTNSELEVFPGLQFCLKNKINKNYVLKVDVSSFRSSVLKIETIDLKYNWLIFKIPELIHYISDDYENENDISEETIKIANSKHFESIMYMIDPNCELYYDDETDETNDSQEKPINNSEESDNSQSEINSDNQTTNTEELSSSEISINENSGNNDN